MEWNELLGFSPSLLGGRMTLLIDAVGCFAVLLCVRLCCIGMCVMRYYVMSCFVVLCVSVLCFHAFF